MPNKKPKPNILLLDREDRSYSWPTTGEKQNILSEESIYCTSEIKDFLYHNKKLILVASKGMGKTLLLRFKKQIISDRKERCIILPKGKNIDYVTLSVSLGKEFTVQIEKYKFWEEIWIVSIILALLSSVSFETLEDLYKCKLKESIQEMKINRRFKEDIFNNIDNNIKSDLLASDVLVDILSGSINSYNYFIKKHLGIINKIFTNYIHEDVYSFIDSFDQVLKESFPDNYQVWNEGQKGLVLASWHINRHNPKIKIFTSIRHEAFASFHNENALAMKSTFFLLKYEFEELRSMFEHAIKFYERKNSISDFLGIENIHNGRVNQYSEDCFKYIYRHSNYTPRSLMALGGELSQKLKGVDQSKMESKIRNIVNEESSTIVVKDYLKGEMEYFLSELDSDKKINDFFSLINKNILTYDNLVSISSEYKSNLEIQFNEDAHPFCDLFNIGLLGLTSIDLNSGKKIQRFSQPYQFDWKMNHILPTHPNNYFLIHPSLNQFILKLNPRYKVQENIVIGNNYEWKESYNKELEKSKIQIFFAYSSVDKNGVKMISKRISNTMNFKGIYYNSFIDEENIKAGEHVQIKISEALKESDFLLLMVTKHSLQSGWVEQEWKKKYKDEIKNNSVKVITVILDDTKRKDLPSNLRDKMSTILIQDNEISPREFNKLIEDIISHKTNPTPKKRFFGVF